MKAVDGDNFFVNPVSKLFLNDSSAVLAAEESSVAPAPVEVLVYPEICFSPREETGIGLGFKRDLSMTDQDWEVYGDLERDKTLRRTRSFETELVSENFVKTKYRKVFEWSKQK